MTTDRDTIRIVESWLDEGVSVLPDHVLDSVVAQLRDTPQRRSRGVGRTIQLMNNMVRLGVATAIVIGVALVGYQVLPHNDMGGRQPAPAIAPTPAPTPAPLPQSGPLHPGTYLMPEGWGGAPFSFTVPSGWAIDRDGFVSKNTDATMKDATTGVLLAAFEVDHVYADACHTKGTLRPVGPTVDALATALANQAGRQASDPIDIVLGGYRGKRLELTAPTDLSACNGFLHTWADVGGAETGGWPAGAGQTDEIYILDVAGSRLVIVAAHWPRTPQDDLVELNKVVASIQIKRAGQAEPR